MKCPAQGVVPGQQTRNCPRPPTRDHPPNSPAVPFLDKGQRLLKSRLYSSAVVFLIHLYTFFLIDWNRRPTLGYGSNKSITNEQSDPLLPWWRHSMEVDSTRLPLLSRMYFSRPLAPAWLFMDLMRWYTLKSSFWKFFMEQPTQSSKCRFRYMLYLDQFVCLGVWRACTVGRTSRKKPICLWSNNKGSSEIL